MKKTALILIFIIAFSLCISTNPYEREFAGVTLHFRANLNEAKNIPVYPDEESLKKVLLNPDVLGIGIAFIPNETENPYYLADAYELAYKLTIINKYYFQRVKPIATIPLNDTTEVFDFASYERPVILLLGPSQTGVTAVTVRGFVIFAEGENFSEVERTYTDLDLAVDKILLVLMD
jgi:hypothetical protein